MERSLHTGSAIPVHASDSACIDLVNSRFADHLGRGGTTDRLPNPEWQAWFLDRYGLFASEEGPVWVTDGLKLRQDIEGLLDSWRAGEALDHRTVDRLGSWLGRAEVRQTVRMTESGIRLTCEAVAADWNWTLARITASAVELMSTGEARRLKRCANPDCSWMYYDRTLNGSKEYCSTTPCGTLMRVRRHRHRRRSNVPGDD